MITPIIKIVLCIGGPLEGRCFSFHKIPDTLCIPNAIGGIESYRLRQVFKDRMIYSVYVFEDSISDLELELRMQIDGLCE